MTNKTYIYQYNTKFELINTFNTITAAAKSINISNTSIHKAIVGERNLAGGYFWYKGHKPLQKIPEKWIYFIEQDGILGSKAKPVAQLDKNGCVVAEYDSIIKASKALGKNERGISSVVNGKQNTAYGYKWVLIEENN